MGTSDTLVEIGELLLIPGEWYIHRLEKGNLGAQFVGKREDLFFFKFMSIETLRMVCPDETPESLELGLTKSEVLEKIRRL